MKPVRFLFFLALTVAFGIALNNDIGSVPPLGKLLSPFEGFWQNAETPDATQPEMLDLEGLEAPVTVYYDELDIPHIFAENDRDLHFVQGYITARDRLWQMDFFSRLVYGRLSEVLGERALDFDRGNRRIGLRDMTEQLYEVIQKDRELAAILQAYSDGVNSYLNQLKRADHPIEFKLLNYEPEAWTPEKSCIAYAMLSNTLSKGDADLENTNALSILGRTWFDLLFPEQLGNLSPVIPTGTRWNFSPIPVTKPNVNYPLVATPNTLEKPHPLNGSNNFVVAGSKSKSGHVLLANEPDLELTLPSIWYAAHLHSPAKNVMGVTVPGTPVLLIGFNDSIAWGVTNSPRDQVDWYAIRFKNEQRDEYWYNNQWFKTEKRIEKYEVRDADVYYDTVILVHHGPVVYDRHFLGDGQKTNYAMRWIAHQPGTTFSTMNKLNKAANLQDFHEAMRDFTGPPQNFIFGSAAGDIALFLPGQFPVKWKEQGKFLMDGSDPAYEWKNYIPFEHSLQASNPTNGFLSSANQHPVDSLYPYYVYDHHYEYYRNRRINDRLTLLNNITEKEMMKLQHDNYNYLASENLTFLLDSLDSAALSASQVAYRKDLQAWDYFNDPERTAPVIFQLWQDHLLALLWDELDTSTIVLDKPNKFTSFHLLRTQPEFPFANILATSARENTRDLINLAFQEAADSLDQWVAQNNLPAQWYAFKNTSVNHLLRLEPFSEREIKIGGYGGIVNAAGKGHGPSWRMVVELDPSGPKAWGVYPGSQTGNPGSFRYAEMIEEWANGTYFPLLFGHQLDGSKQVTFKQLFNPAP